MEKQVEFTFTMGSDSVVHTEWKRLRRQIADMVSRDFGGCRFVHGDGAWRLHADEGFGPFNGELHHDETLTLIVAVSEEIAGPAFGLIRSSIVAAIRVSDLTTRIDWIDTTEREVTARHWQASKFFKNAA